ncbi:MAG: ABC transporter ATP-binding protein/permease [Firmicutes bacterium]|nr:ABC transporter ATP-binding protein/permease [Bacillota bacterium]
MRNRYFEDEQLVYKFSTKAFKKTLSFARPYRKTIAIVFVFMAIFAFVALAPPMITRFLIDYVITTQDGFLGLEAVQTAIILIAVLMLVYASDIIFTFLNQRLMLQTGHKMVHDIRHNTFKNLQKLSFDFFDSRPAGKILVRLTNYLDEVAEVFARAILAFIIDGARVVMIMVWLFILHPQLALVVLACTLPMAVSVYFLRRGLAKRWRICRNKISNRTAYIAESIQGSFVSRSFNRNSLNNEIYKDVNAQNYRSWMRVIHVHEFFHPALDGFFWLGMIAVYSVIIVFGGRFFGLEGITLGIIVSFIAYMGMFSQPLNNIAMYMQRITSAMTNLERVYELGETPSSIYDEKDASDMQEVDGEVKFENISFFYEKGVPVLENFSLDVERGKMIALVGPTGGGKTTIVSLLSRFYDPQEGRILIDGNDIKKVKLHSLRTQVGVMMQDAFIFSGTILENIRYARPDATREECIRAAESVYANEFIEKLEKSYDTETKEGGGGISSGEKQLLSLARLILCDPKILILDEATANIDTQTEDKIKKALDTVLKGRTSFVVAHRLSTIKKADAILYIDNLGIQEAGTHDSLMQKQGLYYTLVQKGTL